MNAIDLSDSGQDGEASDGGRRLSLKQQMIRGSSLMLLLQIAGRVVGVVSLGFLARLLSPSDFGLVALAAAVSGVLTAAITTNFSTAVISLPAPDRSDYDTAWTLNAARGTLLALLLCLASYVVFLSSGRSRVPELLTALSLVPFLDGVRNVGMAALRRDLRFSPIVWVELAGRVSGSFGAVLLAYLTGSYWALVAGPLIASSVGLVGTFAASSYRPRLNLSRWRKLWAFSGWLAGGNLVSSVSGYADVFFVNHYLGLGVTGIYSTGNQVGAMFHGQVVTPLLASLFPGLARLVGIREVHLRAFRKAREVLIGVCLPAGIGLGLVADGLVLTVLGSEWAMAGPVVAIVSLAFTVHLANIGMDDVLLSIQRTKPIFTRQALGASVRLALMFAGVYYGGLVGLLFGRLLGAVGVAGMNARVLCRELRIPATELLLPHARTILATALMVGGVLSWQSTVLRLSVSTHALGLAADVAVGIVLYGTALALTWIVCGRPDGFEREAIALFKARMGSWRHRASA